MTSWSDEGGQRDPELDERLAALVGKRVLVGITRLNAGGEPVERRQHSGLISAASRQAGVTVEQDDNAGPLTLPPAPEAFEPASRGHYRLRASGRVVIDPDLLATWTVRARADG